MLEKRSDGRLRESYKIKLIITLKSPSKTKLKKGVKTKNPYLSHPNQESDVLLEETNDVKLQHVLDLHAKGNKTNNDYLKNWRKRPTPKKRNQNTKKGQINE